MKEDEIRKYLNVIKRAVTLVEGLLNDDGGLLETMVEQSPQQPVARLPKVKPDPVIPVKIDHVSPKTKAAETFKAERAKHVNDLMSIPSWPEAAPEKLNRKASKKDMIDRANSVLDFTIGRSLQGKKFLDFGCGAGWEAYQAHLLGAETSGYDIVSSSEWKDMNGTFFTTDIQELKKDYYDCILLMDVLDHCQDPMLIMSQVKSLIKKNGVVYVRCHPWTSRHATHLFKQGINKAYLHLFLTYTEIAQFLSEPPIFTRPEKNPLEAYHWWFHEFDIKKESAITEPVDNFFKIDAFKNLLATEQQIAIDKIDEFLKLMEIQFVYFELLPKK